ncbi:MAG TPA: efflux transporter outer membrane subunit, partial [Verrucomicrobiae bacterium]
MSRRTAALPLICLCLAWLAGCAVGPNYKRPKVDSPAVFRGENQATNRSFADLAWWDVYQDEILQALIREAFTNNYDLRIAVTRVEQSRQLAAQAKSQFFPSVNYSGSASQGRNYLFGGAYPENGTTGGSAVATLNAFWEVDLWGRIRRLNEEARAQFLASEEARRDVRISLLSDVATEYFQLMELDQEFEIAMHTTNSFAGSLQIFQQRMSGGTASALETSRAQAALEDAEAAIPSILEQMATTENELSILLGRVPGPIIRKNGDFDSLMPPEIPAGLPSSLVERRPDVREAEQNLRAANAAIGESVAEFFPTIGLTALFGKISPELSAVTAGTANAWGIAADASGPLFEGGRLVAQYRQRKAARDEALLSFQQTALTALRDVSDALIDRDRLGEIREHQAREVRSLETAVTVSTERYRAGKASYYEVLEAQQQLFPSELN